MSTECGKKRMCTTCSTLFYDFGKSPIICPRCGEKVSQDDLLKRKTKQQDRYEELDNNIIEENLDVELHDHEDHHNDDEI